MAAVQPPPSAEPPPSSQSSVPVSRAAKMKVSKAHPSTVRSQSVSRVLGAAGPEGVVLAQKQVKKLPPAEKGLWEWILSLFPPTPKSIVMDLVKSYAEHRQPSLQEFAIELREGNYEGTGKIRGQISALIRQNYPQIKELLGEDETKRFLFHFIGNMTPANAKNEWGNFLKKQYGDSYATEIFTAGVVGMALEKVKTDPEMNAEGFCAQLQIALKQPHGFSQSKLNREEVVAELKKSEKLALQGAASFRRCAEIAKSLGSIWVPDKDHIASLERDGSDLEGVARTLNGIHTSLSQSTPASAKELFLPKEIPVELRTGHQLEWNATVTVLKDKMSGDWNRVLLRRGELAITTPGSFLSDVHRATTHIGNKTYKMEDVVKRLPDKTNPKAGDPIIDEINEEFRAFLQKALPNTNERQRNLLRYQIQDLATQRLIWMDTDSKRPLLYARISSEYDTKGYVLLPDGKSIEYSYTIVNDKLLITGSKAFEVKSQIDPGGPALGYEGIKVSIEIDLKKFDPDVLLFGQQEGCFTGTINQVGCQPTLEEVLQKLK